MDAVRTAMRERWGCQSALARQLGITTQAVYLWMRSDRPVPARWLLKVEALTGLSRYELRPDIFGDAPPASSSASSSSSSDAEIRGDLSGPPCAGTTAGH